MAIYTLHVYSPDIKTLSCTAVTRTDALSILSKELGYGVTDQTEDEDWPEDNMMLDEWEESPHWVAPHIPIYRVRGSRH